MHNGPGVPVNAAQCRRVYFTASLAHRELDNQAQTAGRGLWLGAGLLATEGMA
jgi:hypothetical protein